MNRAWWSALVLLGACLNLPAYEDGALECDRGACPPGYRCREDGRCYRPGAPVVAGSDAGMTGADAADDDAPAPPDARPPEPPPDAPVAPPSDAMIEPPPDAALEPPPDARFDPPPDARFDPPPDARFDPPPDAPPPLPPDASPPPPPPDAAPPPPDACVPVIWSLDGDGDGYASMQVTQCDRPGPQAGWVQQDLPGDDCDDGNGTTHPGAQEICDSKDNDCDGMSDEGATGIATWSFDGDGDQHADPSITPLMSCTSPGTGWRTDAIEPADCDDGDAARYPGKTEVCDGKDNDCDGVIDDNVPPSQTETCTVGVGQCVRTGPLTCSGGSFRCEVSPGSPGAEVCNGLDDDCDLSTDEADWFGAERAGGACFQCLTLPSFTSGMTKCASSVGVDFDKAAPDVYHNWHFGPISGNVLQLVYRMVMKEGDRNETYLCGGAVSSVTAPRTIRRVLTRDLKGGAVIAGTSELDFIYTDTTSSTVESFNAAFNSDLTGGPIGDSGFRLLVQAQTAGDDACATASPPYADCSNFSMGQSPGLSYCVWVELDP